MLDGWTTVFQVPGKRTTGTGAQTYAITGPGWKGTLPAGVKEYKSPTSIVWLLGRIYCTGTPEDYAEVHKLQDEFKLVPLSSYGKPYTPPHGTVDPSIDMKTAVREQVNRMDAVAYFTLLCKLMKDNPPTAADAPEIAKFARIGIVPGQDFDASKLKADFVKRIPEIGFDRIMLQFKINKDVKDENGWGFTTKTGIYGTDYLMRALVTAIGLGANRPQDAVYPTSLKDAESRKYSGANKYVHALPQGAIAAGARLLVGDDVRRRLFLREQSTQPLLDQRAAEFEIESGRLDRSLHPEGFTGPGQGIELAAGTIGRFRPDDAAVLAEREETVDHRWIVESPGGEEGRLNDVRAGGRRHLMIAAGISLISLKPGSMYPQTHEFDHHA